MLGFALRECVEVCWVCVCVRGSAGGFLHSDVCGEGIGSSYAAFEYGSCRVCMEGRCIEAFRWGGVKEVYLGSVSAGTACGGVGCCGRSAGECEKASPV